MKTRIGLSLLLAAVLGAFCLLTPRVSASGAAGNSGRSLVKTYRIADLPVWTKDGQFEPKFLIHSIRCSVDPESWEANGGKSTMGAFLEENSLVISTTRETHRRIQQLLEQYR